MANDRHVIQYMSPAELVGLMNATGVVTVHDTITADGKPVIHAALKVVNAETGEQLPGGLPFSVVMFKSQNEPGYSNVAIGTIVPASELSVALPRDYFNFCNQRFRFCRVFPVDERSFVIQMDLVLRNATREYVKFAFGLWGALFSQMLFELMGRRRESLTAAAEAYALAHTDFAQQFAATPETATAEPVAEMVTPESAVTESEAEPAVLPLEAEAVVEPGAETATVEEPPVEEIAAVEAVAEPVVAETAIDEIVAEPAVTEPAAEPAVIEQAVIAPEAEPTVTEPTVTEPAMTEPVEPFEDAVAPVEPAEAAAESELSIAAGLTVEPSPIAELPAEEVAQPLEEIEADNAVLAPAAEAVVVEPEAKEAVPA